ncbi:hypothetical protein BRARA_D00094 [Brassica rapa]|uniref:GDT1 family protein n=1 Tax=Brassica campestris TaxID=3711 RepID=A0A397ZKH0_BRACM|nr:hypothetical protein BRARA_D00094 [Brassica rapa]
MSSVLQGFTKSFFKIEFSEVGDKTFCVAAILAMRNPRRLVLAGCVSASIVTTIISATLGWAAPDLISRQWTHHITTLLFFGFGLWFLWYGFKQGGGLLLHQILMRGAETPFLVHSKTKKKKKQKRPFFTRFFSPIFLKAFLFTFFAEFGDKSLRTTIRLAADENPFGVVLGGVVAQLFCTTVALLRVKFLPPQMLSEEKVELAGRMLFLGFGIQSFLTSVDILFFLPSLYA